MWQDSFTNLKIYTQYIENSGVLCSEIVLATLNINKLSSMVIKIQINTSSSWDSTRNPRCDIRYRLKVSSNGIHRYRTEKAHTSVYQIGFKSVGLQEFFLILRACQNAMFFLTCAYSESESGPYILCLINICQNRCEAWVLKKNGLKLTVIVLCGRLPSEIVNIKPLTWWLGASKSGSRQSSLFHQYFS